MGYHPFKNHVGEFSPNDGTIDFYLRINSLINKNSIVLDLGAGRAKWFEDDPCEIRRDIRLLKGKVKKVIAADIDDAVLGNRASDEQIIIKDGKIDLKKNSVDLVIADYVLEHVEDPEKFVEQINFVLKDGGWFCARTPHKYSYVALISSLVKNKHHTKVLKYVKPELKEMDVFPTTYKMNTHKDLSQAFDGWDNRSFVFRADPGYYFGNKCMYWIQDFFHRILFKQFSGNIFALLQKSK